MFDMTHQKNVLILIIRLLSLFLKISKIRRPVCSNLFFYELRLLVQVFGTIRLQNKDQHLLRAALGGLQYA